MKAIPEKVIWECWNILWGDARGVYHVSSLGTDKIRRMLEYFQHQEADNAP